VGNETDGASGQTAASISLLLVAATVEPDDKKAQKSDMTDCT